MTATFVLSPGRCGTQWLARHLQASNPEGAVTHEPLHLAYAPMTNSPSKPLAHHRELLLAHLAQIEGQLQQGGHYMECGFPCWRHLDWFRQELGGDVKLIYIHRNPIDNARSLLKLNVFVPPILPHLQEKQFFHPEAPEAQLPHYAGRWPDLTPFEKCLYYWAEVNLQAARYRQDWPEQHWLTVPYDSLFTPATVARIADFSGLAFGLERDTFQPVDRFNGEPQGQVVPHAIGQHPEILALARQLGYAC
ncbi:hypothetical protein [Shewanella salipaludis]|uniref:Sulfotransferase family protein n=1 Tax=Shewanella salipaludis TaxID=2723052 RepID=A0A972JLG6_9GAMM|nr:hypothetical protein [Shewanella salipaludis]NMH65422.1 hypothetical protein [Shewanella salipaludis]